MSFSSIPERVQQQARTQPDAAAYFVRRDGAWQPTSWGDYAIDVRRAGKALIALGIEPGQTACVVGFNRPEWITFHVACMSIGAVPVGIYTTNSPGEMQYIVAHAEASVVLLEDVGQWCKIEQERTRLPALRRVVMMRGTAPIADPIVQSWETFCARGDGVPDAQFDRRLAALAPEQLATLIYTSGTTGPPKGVMLSHHNLAWTAQAAIDIFRARPSDALLSYLPLSHIAEQMFTIHGAATAGYAVYFAESIEKVADNLKEVQPHIFFGVPRIWEKFHAGISAKLREAQGIKRRLVEWAMRIAGRVSADKCAGRQPSGTLALQYRLADRLIYSKLKPAVGLGRARLCVSGAAPIAPDVLEFFSRLDVLIHEVYGQSEDSGPTSFNLPGQTDFHTVGRPMPGVEVRIAADGEILVRGPNVFMGYYKDPAATAETLVDGWLHSGDLGELRADGFLRITGRKKEIIITAGGKNITPKNIEAALKQLPLISEATVIGDRRKYLTALLTLDDEAAAKFATEHQLDGVPLHNHPALLAAVAKHVETVNAQFARVEGVKRFRILSRGFTIEDGELTPTLKVKRKVVEQHFAREIEAMYAEDDETSSTTQPRSTPAAAG
jgi:long-chain acyl-CoA synthetase